MYQVKASDTLDIRLNLTDTIESVLQNIAIILKTWKGECPLYRDFGISADALHRPINAARAMLQAEIIEMIEEYEPRAAVVGVSFDVDSEYPDLLSPIVEVEIEGYEEEDEDGA